MYLGFVFVMISSTGGEPIFDNSAEGSGTAEALVILDGQSWERSTSTRGEEAGEDAMDAREEAQVARDETVLESNFVTVCDVK
jgi:hypothetical protein